MNPGVDCVPLNTVRKDKAESILGVCALGGYVLDDMFEAYGRLGLSVASIQI